MTKDQIAGAFMAVIALAMIFFPKAFIALNDFKAAMGGYRPEPGHLMRSPMLFRGLGVLVLFIAILFFTAH
jgi:hypothetical protein